ncbi:MAG: hypothetical protein K2P88_00190 [Chitinophagaceae bacterium]|nr:hypothetical protein [Chitinophagaceae bacterium]
MRSFLIFIILILVFTNLSAQIIPQGTYNISGGFVNHEIEFRSGKQFYYKYSSCTGGFEGKGHYTLTKRILELHFETDSTEKNENPPIYRPTPLTGDSAILSLNVLNSKDSSASSWIYVYVFDKDQKQIGSTQTILGRALIKVASTEFPIQITLNAIGFTDDYIHLKEPANYELIHPFQLDFMKTLGTGAVLKFKIDSIDEDALVIKPINEKEYRTWYRKE